MFLLKGLWIKKHDIICLYHCPKIIIVVSVRIDSSNFTQVIVNNICFGAKKIMD